MPVFRSDEFHPSLALAKYIQEPKRVTCMVQQVTLKKAEFSSAFSVAVALFCRDSQTEDGAGQDPLSYAYAATAEDFRERIYSSPGGIYTSWAFHCLQ